MTHGGLPEESDHRAQRHSREGPREEIEETEKGSYFEMLAVVVGKVKENSVGVKCSRTAGRFTARGDCHGRI